MQRRMVSSRASQESAVFERQGDAGGEDEIEEVLLIKLL
jgi:hypothetical protein